MIPPDAAPRALSVPELLSAVFDAICNESRKEYTHTLLACAQVNWSWHHEANKRLWSSCGYVGYPPLSWISELLWLPRCRIQDILSCIQYLYVYHEKDFATLKIIDSGHVFPRLLGFTLFPNPRCRGLETLPDLRSLTPSTLQRVEIEGKYYQHSKLGIKEDFVVSLINHCENLTKFHFGGRMNPALFPIAPRALVDLVVKNKNLQFFTWDTNESISADLIIALSKLQHLETLCISTIHSSWLTPIINPPKANLLNSLTCLDISTYSTGLSMLLPHLKNMGSLNLAVDEDVGRIVEAIGRAGMAGLRSLRIEPHVGGLIHAPDLIRLAFSTGLLEMLDLAWNIGSHPEPEVQDLDDSVIADVSTALPFLKEFNLVCSNQDSLTEQSLLWLGRMCPELEICCISANVAYDVFDDPGTINLWSRLKCLQICNSGPHVVWDDDDDEEQERLEELAEKVLRAMPVLINLIMDRDEKFSRFLHSRIYPGSRVS